MAKTATKKKAPAKRSTTGGKKASGRRKKAAKRELIDTGRDKRYVRRDEEALRRGG